MAENPTFSLSKPWPKTRLSLVKNSALSLSTLAENPTLSLSLKPWQKTQFSLSLSLSLNTWLFVVSDLWFYSSIWDLSFVFGFLKSTRKFGLSFVFGAEKSRFEFCLCVIVECLWVLSLCNCWKKTGLSFGFESKFCLCNCGHVFVFVSYDICWSGFLLIRVLRGNNAPFSLEVMGFSQKMGKPDESGIHSHMITIFQKKYSSLRKGT